MPLVEVFATALGSIRANLFRAALTMLGVVIGVAAVITMVALGAGAQRAIDEQLQSFGGNVLTIGPGPWFLRGVSRQRDTLDIADAELLARESRHLAGVAPEMSLREQVKLGGRNLNLRITGTTANYAEVQAYSVAEGRMFTAADDAARRRVVVLGGDVPSQFESDAAAMIGRTVQIRAVPFEVIGVFERKGEFAPGMSGDTSVFIPLQTARHRLTGSDALQSIGVEVAPGSTAEQAMVDAERLLRRAHGIPPGRDNDFAIYDRKTILNVRAQAAGILGYLLAGIAGISLLVGGIGIMNVMLVTVTERTREIGIRKALGATRGAIMAQFLVESVTLCLLGGAMGIALGAGLAALLSNLAGWQTAVTAESVLLAFGFSAAVGILFGLMPARRAARMDPIEALRHE